MASDELKAKIQKQIESTHVLLYCKTTCSFCTRVCLYDATRSMHTHVEKGLGGRGYMSASIALHCICHPFSFVFLQVKRLFSIHCVDYTPVELDLLGKQENICPNKLRIH